jgi:hypothetical protein
MSEPRKMTEEEVKEYRVAALSEKIVIALASCSLSIKAEAAAGWAVAAAKKVVALAPYPGEAQND